MFDVDAASIGGRGLQHGVE
jgi:hypothetical protein